MLLSEKPLLVVLKHKKALEFILTLFALVIYS